MESYDVIANQPVVIDNVSCIPLAGLMLSSPKGSLPVFQSGLPVLCHWPGLSGGFSRRRLSPPSTRSPQIGRPAGQQPWDGESGDG